MTTKFLEPGGDADFGILLWDTTSATTVVSDFVHGNHLRSLKIPPGSSVSAATKPGVVGDTGTRISFYLYVNALPSALGTFAQILTSGVVTCINFRMTTAGVLQLWNTVTAQIGADGPALATGRWYRISLAYTITSGSVNRLELSVDGNSAISITNATITNTSTSIFRFSNAGSNGTQDMRVSDVYIDDSSSLTDPGDIWVTAKRPNANGTTNGFTTQIGAGGSGYGTGHSPQVNERALSTTNGWSMIGAGSAITEEYSIEDLSTGDINLIGADIVDYGGWLYQGSLVSETAKMITGGTSSTYATGTSANMITSFKGSTAYPAGGTVIGMTTATDLTTVSLYECGILVAYIPHSGASPSSYLFGR
jgi:hypothetical protein